MVCLGKRVPITKFSRQSGADKRSPTPTCPPLPEHRWESQLRPDRHTEKGSKEQVPVNLHRTCTVKDKCVFQQNLWDPENRLSSTWCLRDLLPQGTPNLHSDNRCWLLYPRAHGQQDAQSIKLFLETGERALHAVRMSAGDHVHTDTPRCKLLALWALASVCATAGQARLTHPFL